MLTYGAFSYNHLVAVLGCETNITALHRPHFFFFLANHRERKGHGV